MEPGAALTEVVARVLDAAGRAPARPVLVAVDGRSGSGKSTFADALVAGLRHALGGPGAVALLRLDAVYPGWDGLAAAVATLQHEVLPVLAAGEDAGYRSWLWTRSRPGPPRTVPAARCVVVEGVGSGAVGSRDLLDCLVWVQAPDDVRHRRAMARDGETYRPHWRRWAAQEEAYLAAHRPAAAADVTVDTHATT